MIHLRRKGPHGANNRESEHGRRYASERVFTTHVGRILKKRRNLRKKV